MRHRDYLVYLSAHYHRDAEEPIRVLATSQGKAVQMVRDYYRLETGAVVHISKVVRETRGNEYWGPTFQLGR